MKTQAYTRNSLRILMPVLYFDEVPGKWTYFKEMASRLTSAGHEIIVISPHAKGNKRKEKKENIKVYRCSSTYLPKIPLPIVNPLDFFSTLKEIIQNENRIDVIYDTTSGVLPLSIFTKLIFKLKGIRTPLIIHVCGELKDLASNRFLSLLSELYLNTITRLCFAMADKILLAGDKLVPRVLSLGGHSSKIKIIRVGLKYEDKLSQQHEPIGKEDKMKIENSIGLHDEDFVVGNVGRLSPGKGIDILLKAVAMVKDAIPNLKVVLVGDGMEKERLRELASEIGIRDITIFLGHREDVLLLLQLMDVYVNLSKSEACISASQIEAMRFALPSIITPLSDIVDNMKDTIVVPFDDIKTVANKILLLYQNEALRTELGMNASIKAQKRLKSHSWDNYVNEVIEIFARARRN